MAIVPTTEAKLISIESALGTLSTLGQIEASHTHIQWLNSGAPSNEEAIQYRYHQHLRILHPTELRSSFSIIDFTYNGSEGIAGEQEFVVGKLNDCVTTSTTAIPCDTKNFPSGNRFFNAITHAGECRSSQHFCPSIDGPHSPEGVLCRIKTNFTEETTRILQLHTPNWKLAEPLGLLALAIREFLSHSEILRLSSQYAQTLNHDAAAIGYGRLAYSVETPATLKIKDHDVVRMITPTREQSCGQNLAHLKHRDCEASTAEPHLRLHIIANDPCFSEDVVRSLVSRAQEFAQLLGSAIDCQKIFRDIQIHERFPATVREPDVVGSPVLFYRVPLAVEVLPDFVFPCSLREAYQVAQLTQDHTQTTVVIHRDADSGEITARGFTPGTNIIDRKIVRGGYLDTQQLLDMSRRDILFADRLSLAAQTTLTRLWESLATWGLAGLLTANSTIVKVTAASPKRQGNSISGPMMNIHVAASASLGSILHDVCDVLDSLGVQPDLDFPIAIHWETSPTKTQNPRLSAIFTQYDAQVVDYAQLPCLWPRALGALKLASSDFALAVASTRTAIQPLELTGISWIGVRHQRIHTPTAEKHRISLAFSKAAAHLSPPTDASAGIVQDILAAVQNDVAVFFPGLEIEVDLVDARQLTQPNEWVTAFGYHPQSGLLPAYIQLEHLLPQQ